MHKIGLSRRRVDPHQSRMLRSCSISHILLFSRMVVVVTAISRDALLCHLLPCCCVLMQQLAEALEADNASVVIKKKGSKKRGDRERRLSITKCALAACLPSVMQESSCGGSPPHAPHCTVAIIIRLCTAAVASVTRLYPVVSFVAVPFFCCACFRSQSSHVDPGRDRGTTLVPLDLTTMSVSSYGTDGDALSTRRTRVRACSALSLPRTQECPESLFLWTHSRVHKSYVCAATAVVGY